MGVTKERIRQEFRVSRDEPIRERLLKKRKIDCNDVRNDNQMSEAGTGLSGRLWMRAVTKDCRGVNGALAAREQRVLRFFLTTGQAWFLLVNRRKPTVL